MKKLSLFFISLVVSLPLLASGMVNRDFLNGKVTISTPSDFGPMPKEMIDIKYPNSQRPTEVLANKNGTVTLNFNHTANAITQAQIPGAHKAISKMFHNAFPSAEWIRDQSIDINGNNFIVLEVITPAIDTKIHNIIYGTSVDNRLLLVSFNTTQESSSKWLPLGKEMMSSLIIN